MRSAVALVTHPECNDVEGYAGLEQMHRGGVVLLPELEPPMALNAETMSTSKGTRLSGTQCWRGLQDYTDA